MTSHAPQRCLVMDLPGIFTSQRETKLPALVRVVGIVVSKTKLLPTASNNTASKATFHGKSNQDEWILLESDDGTGTVSCLVSMAMMERVMFQVGDTLDCVGELQLADEMLLFVKAETLLDVPSYPKDQAVAEHLRWMEIAHRDTIAWCGYPCPSATSDDVYSIIDSNQEGVTTTDLALVMDLHPKQVQLLIEDLQLQGLIYENASGSYVPL